MNMRAMAWAQGIALLVVLGLYVAVKQGVAGSERALLLAWLGHGVVFLIYIAMLGWAMGRKALSARESWIGFVAAMIPLGSLVFERSVLKTHPKIR